MYDFWRLYREGGGKKGVFLVFFRHFRGGGGFWGFLGFWGGFGGCRRGVGSMMTPQPSFRGMTEYPENGVGEAFAREWYTKEGNPE